MDIRSAIDAINQELKFHPVVDPGDEPFYTVRAWIPTNLAPLDGIMTCRDESGNPVGRGIPLGKVIGISGDESVGKSTLETWIRIQFQRAGGFTVHLDSESGFYAPRAKAMGYNPDLNLELEVDTLEQAFQAIETTIEKLRTPIKSNDPESSPVPLSKPLLLSWDTISNLPSESELDSDYGGGTMKGPRTVRVFCRRIANILARNNATLLIVAQSMDTMTPYGSPTTPSYQGRGIKFLAQILLAIKGRQVFGDPPEGKTIEVKVTKSKLFRPLGTVNIPLFFVNGFVPSMAAVDYLIEEKVISGGAYLAVGDLDLRSYGIKNPSGKATYDELTHLYDSNDNFRKDLNELVYKTLNW